MNFNFHEIQKLSITRGTKAKIKGQDAKQKEGKLKYSTIPRSLIRWLAAGIAYGSAKYVEESWKKVSIADWHDAYDRHISAIVLDNEVFDKESGLPHMVHAFTCQAYVTWLILKHQGLVKED